MDATRLKDIERFDKVINNPKKHPSVRLAADRAKQQIVRQMKDPVLSDMRRSLVRAVQAYDEVAEWKIGNRIKDYVKEHRLEPFT